MTAEQLLEKISREGIEEERLIFCKEATSIREKYCYNVFIKEVEIDKISSYIPNRNKSELVNVICIVAKSEDKYSKKEDIFTVKKLRDFIVSLDKSSEYVILYEFSENMYCIIHDIITNSDANPSKIREGISVCHLLY